jgi:hypothetical protein
MGPMLIVMAGIDAKHVLELPVGAENSVRGLSPELVRRRCLDN